MRRVKRRLEREEWRGGRRIDKTEEKRREGKEREEERRGGMLFRLLQGKTYLQFKSVNNDNNSIQFNSLSFMCQQLLGQVQTQHSVDTIIQ
jgi:hypothetical protein